ncbi:MAG: Formamidopyrimidine-DNA glycosylase [Planctomycetota bacterium]
MPELPEVETMVRGLRPAMVGAVVTKIEILDPFLLHKTTADLITQALNGQILKAIHRRGKWVVLEFESESVLVIEPRMTGGFWLVSPARPDHARLIFHTDINPYTIWFCDTRRLGRIRLFSSLTEAELEIRKSQAEDALTITKEQLYERLKKTTRAIKPTLMDQKVVSGIGNIYADEVLFASRIHPERTSSDLKKSEIAVIHENISLILEKAIAAEGTSFDAGYRTVLGLEGGFLAINSMYGHGGEPCPVCSTKIVKTQISGLAGRPTHYCPKCQQLPKKRKS